MKLNFSILGEPRGKGRPQFHRKSGRVYTPAETAAQEEWVRATFKQKFPRHRPFTGPVMVRMTAVFPIPKGFNQAQRAAAGEGRLYFTGKPDKDNIEKLVYDALNGVAWVDDGQVQGGCIKRYGSPERVDVTIEPLEGLPETNSDRRRRKQQDQRAQGKLKL